MCASTDVHYDVIYIMYIGMPMKPTVTVLPGQLIELTDSNSTLVMRCSSYNFDFNYEWEKKNDRLPSRAQGVNTEELIIIGLSPKDSGEYRCIVSNSTGMISSNYLLVTIKGL